MRILLTGAAGFIGSHLAEALLARGDEVIGLDSFDDSYARERKEANVEDLPRWPGWYLVRGDVRNGALVRRLCAKDEIDAVVHLAARCTLPEASESPELHAQVNVTGTTALLEAAHRSGVRRFALASSASVYGRAGQLPLGLGSPADRPLSVHAATRRAAELLLAAYAERGRLATVALRLFTIYGERQRPDQAVASFLAALSAGKPIRRSGDGTQQRDLLHVEDAVRGILAGLDQAADRSAGHRSFNLGSGTAIALNELIEACEIATGQRTEVEEVRAPPGEVPRLQADLDDTRRELGWEPRIALEEGLQRQLTWLTAEASRAAAEASVESRKERER